MGSISISWDVCGCLLWVDTRLHASFSLRSTQKHTFTPLTICKYVTYNMSSISSLHVNFNTYYTLFLGRVYVGSEVWVWERRRKEEDSRLEETFMSWWEEKVE